MKTIYELIQKMKQHRILYLTMDSVRHYVVIDIFKIMMNIQLDIIIDFILGTSCQFMSLLLEKIVCSFPWNACRASGINSIKQPFFHWQ